MISPIVAEYLIRNPKTPYNVSIPGYLTLICSLTLPGPGGDGIHPPLMFLFRKFVQKNCILLIFVENSQNLSADVWKTFSENF